jgi:hypothetical protein
LAACSLSEAPWYRAHAKPSLVNFHFTETTYAPTPVPYNSSSNTTLRLLRSAMQEESLFTYFALYSVLICCEHRGAVYGLDEHLKRYHHNTPISKRRELLAFNDDCYRLPPAEATQPAPYGLSIDARGPPQDAFLCCCSSTSSSSNSSSSSSASNDTNSNDGSVCSYISTSRVKMRQHVNQQHHVKLTRWSSPAAASYEEHAAQLWKLVKVQSFSRERRYVRYFVVQEEEVGGVRDSLINHVIALRDKFVKSVYSWS